MKKLSILLAALILVTGFTFAQEENGNVEVEVVREREIIREVDIERDVEIVVEQEDPFKTNFFNMEVSVGFPVHWNNSIHGNDFYFFNPGDGTDPWNQNTVQIMMLDREVTANTAMGLSLLFNFSKYFGLTLDMDIFYAAKISGFASPTSDYISMFGANAFIGPVIYLFNNGFVKVPFAFGAHMYYFNDEVWMPQLSTTIKPGEPPEPKNTNEGAWIQRRDLQFGPAMYLGVQFHFNRGVYLFTRTNIAIDIFRFHSVRYHTNNTNATPPLPDSQNPGIYVDMWCNECTDRLHVNWMIKPVFGVGIKY